MQFKGIELYNYRSIGSIGVNLQPWQKTNILIGKNNAGKSNVIRAVETALLMTQQHFQSSWESQHKQDAEMPALNSMDLHRGNATKPFIYVLHFEANADNEREQELNKHTGTTKYSFTWEAQGITTHPIDSTFGHLANYDNDRHGQQEFHRLNDLYNLLSQRYYRNWIPSEQMNSVLAENIEGVFRKHFLPALPQIAIIPEFRQIQAGDAYSFQGTNLIAELGRFQHPPEGKGSLRERFDSLQKFVRELLLLPDANLEVTHDNSSLLLSNDGLRLSLSSYGTGVHQLVILLTAVLSLDENTVCCIEEPEIHLHPRLQRELIRFLTEQTKPTYLISSHSPTFISAHLGIESQKELDLQLQHLQASTTGTTSNAVLGDDASLAALDDLGVRASDILQANCIIWVEGPSDRLYINHWLHLLNPNLIEGLHYSIMFYGGRLLAHISLDRSEIPEQLIPLLHINQKSAVVMDSDRERSGQHLSATKLRVRGELDRTGGLAWVTHGREIENYLPTPVLEAFVREQLASAAQKVRLGQYDRIENVLANLVPAKNGKKINYAKNKMRDTRSILQHFTLDHLAGDLHAILNRLERFIQCANGIS